MTRGHVWTASLESGNLFTVFPDATFVATAPALATEVVVLTAAEYAALPASPATATVTAMGDAEWKELYELRALHEQDWYAHAVDERVRRVAAEKALAEATGGHGAMSDAQILAGIQAVLNLEVMRMVWTDSDRLDEFKRAALGGAS